MYQNIPKFQVKDHKSLIIAVISKNYADIILQTAMI